MKKVILAILVLFGSQAAVAAVDCKAKLFNLIKSPSLREFYIGSGEITSDKEFRQYVNGPDIAALRDYFKISDFKFSGSNSIKVLIYKYAVGFSAVPAGYRVLINDGKNPLFQYYINVDASADSDYHSVIFRSPADSLEKGEYVCGPPIL